MSSLTIAQATLVSILSSRSGLTPHYPNLLADVADLVRNFQLSSDEERVLIEEVTEYCIAQDCDGLASEYRDYVLWHSLVDTQLRAKSPF